MKYSAVILAFVAAVAAQSASELAAAIPACAKPALDEAATSVGCELTDYACQCGPKKQELTVTATPKVLEACGTEASAVLDATTALCDFVDANPDAAGGESSSAADQTTAAPSDSSTAAPTTTDSASVVQDSLSSAASSVSSEASSKVADLTSKASSAVAAATSAVTPNAAGMNVVNMGAMLGAAGVAAAMI